MSILCRIFGLHDGQDAETWRRFFLSVWREYGDHN